MLEKVRVVLCEPSHPGNIGAAARAMKTMGLTRLVLVAPGSFPHEDATARASGADDVLTGAEVVPELATALAGVRFALGTSARLRTVAMPQYLPREAAQAVLAATGEGDVALVFGRERTGLTNAEIDRCQALVNIPADPAFSSLNLAAAVQILAYELRLGAAQAARPAPGRPAGEEKADIPALESFFEHLERTLLDIRFLVPRQSATMLKRLRRLVHRAEPTTTEINILRGILSRAQATARRADTVAGDDRAPK